MQNNILKKLLHIEHQNKFCKFKYTAFLESCKCLKGFVYNLKMKVQKMKYMYLINCYKNDFL